MNVLLSPEEYLATHFPEREPEYVHGELKEKPIPDSCHALLQVLLVELLANMRRKHWLSVRTENRCRLAPDEYRLPDIAVFPAGPIDKVPTIPPVLIIEIVSEDEKHVDLISKLRDYAAWGVPHI